MNGKKVFLYYMTRKRRLKRRSRLTQRGVHRKSNRRIHRGGGAQKPVINLCTGLPHPVNGLEYTTKTEEIVKGQPNPDYKSYFDSNCKPVYYVSTNHSSKSAQGKFMILKNPQKVSIVVNKWITLLEPIKARVLGSSKLEMVSMTNVNPFMDYYAQLQIYKSLFENKSMISTRSGTNLLKATMTAASTLGKSMDTEALYSDETIMETFNGITQQYKYYSDMPFNMKEFLGFEGIGGWLGTEASRKKSMDAVDSEVTMLQNLTNPDPQKKEHMRKPMQIEKETKIKAAKTALVLSLYVFCYLNYMPIPKGKMDEDTINRMIQTLNKFYEQINTFSGGGAPEDVEKLLNAYVKDFPKNLADLTKEMEKKRAKPIVGGMFKQNTKNGSVKLNIPLHGATLEKSLGNQQSGEEESKQADPPSITAEEVEAELATAAEEASNEDARAFDEMRLKGVSEASNRRSTRTEARKLLALKYQKEKAAAANSEVDSRVRGIKPSTGVQKKGWGEKARSAAGSAAGFAGSVGLSLVAGGLGVSTLGAPTLGTHGAPTGEGGAGSGSLDPEAEKLKKKYDVLEKLYETKATNNQVFQRASTISNGLGIQAATDKAKQERRLLNDNKYRELRDRASDLASDVKFKGTITKYHNEKDANKALEEAKAEKIDMLATKQAVGKIKDAVLEKDRQGAAETEQLAKQYKYNPKMEEITTDKTSGDYEIAKDELNEALKVYTQDKNDTHRDIVTALYRKVLEISKKDYERASEEKKDEKKEIVDAVQADLEHWTDIRGKITKRGVLNPGELDAKVIGIQIKINETDALIKDLEKKIKGTTDADFTPLTKAVEKEETHTMEVEMAKKKKELQTEIVSVKTKAKAKASDIEKAEKDLKAATEELARKEGEKTEDAKTYSELVAKETTILKGKAPGNDADIDNLVKLLIKKEELIHQKKSIENSSDLQRDFLSETLSYEKTIAYLYRPKDTRDPLKEFYAAIKDGTKTVDELYNLIVKTVKGSGKDKTEDPLDGNENVSYDDLKTFIQANEGENKMRARTHFFMKVVYGFAKDLHKMIKHTTMTGIGVNDHNMDTKFSKNRLKEMKEYLKEMTRSQTLFSFYPNSNDPAAPGAPAAPAATGAPSANPGDKPKPNPKDEVIDEYKFVRLYNSTEYKQARLMFSLKEAKFEHVFENTAYFKDRGFVFIKDPAKYMGMFVKYYYDENDYLKGKSLPKPTFEEKEDAKETDKAYEELGGETTMDKVGKTLKGMNYAGTGTSGQIVRDVFATDDDTGLKSIKTTGKAIIETAKSIEGVFSKNKEKAAQELEKKQENALRKQQIMNVQTGGAVEEPKKFTSLNRGRQFLGGVGSLITGAIAFAWFPTSIVLNIIINPVKIAFYPLGKALFVLFDQVNLLDSSSYKSLGTMADTKTAECKKVVKMLAMNCEQEKDQRANQLLLSVLSNIYNAVDYIEKAEEKFRDRHEYQISDFIPYIEKLVSNIKKDPVKFGEQSLYKSMNEPKKMLYFVYAILQKCNPKTLADAKKGKIDDIDIDKPSDLNKKEIAELQAKIDEINEQKKKQDDQIVQINQLKVAIATGTDDATQRNGLRDLIAIVSNGTTVPSTDYKSDQFKQIVSITMAKADKKISENQKEVAKIEGEKKSLDKQINDLEAKGAKMKAKDKLKIETEDLDKDISEEEKTAAQTLKKNEKPIKELLKKNPPINFDMKEPLEMFKDPKTYLYTRYSGITSGKEMSKTVTLMDGVDMLVPTHLPAAASVFVYKTGQKDETQLAKEAEAKEAADKKAVLAQANADRKSKEAIAKTQSKSAAAATVKAAQIAAQGQISAQVPRGQNPRGPDKGQNRQNRPQNRLQNNTVTKTRTQRVKNAVTNVTRRVTQGVKNATVGIAGKLLTLLGNKKHKMCVKDNGTDMCYDVKTAKNGAIMMEARPR